MQCLTEFKTLLIKRSQNILKDFSHSFNRYYSYFIEQRILNSFRLVVRFFIVVSILSKQ